MSARARKPRPGPQSGSVRGRATWIAVLFVAAATFIAFLPALNAGFVNWDDDKNFIENFAFRGLGTAQIEWMWSTFHLGHYVPLSWMTLGFDYLFWGMDPRGYHLTNLLLHCGVAVVFYGVAARVLGPPPGGIRSLDAGTLSVSPQHTAAFAALFFAIHPLRVESVAWITERRDVLAGLFYFLSIYCYLRAGDAGARTRAWYPAALVSALAAMLSKASAVTLPAALVVLEAWWIVRAPGGHGLAGGWSTARVRAAVWRVLPFAMIAAGVSAVAFMALQAEPQLGIAEKIAVSVYSLGFYLIKTLFPFGLSPLYAMPASVDPTQPAYLLTGALVVCATGAAWSVRRRWPALPLAWLAFVALLFPFLGVHQNGPQIAADRYTYNAAAALALLAAGAFQFVASRARRPALLAAGAIIAFLGTLTWRQTLVWRDSASLWAQVLRIEPDSPVARNNVGNLLMRAGQADEAMLHFRAAVAAKPDYAEAHDNLGVSLAARGRIGEAIAEYQRALTLQPTTGGPHNNWGVALMRQDNLDAAIAHFRLAIAADPGNSDAHVNWGNAAVRLGRTDEAVAHYQDALTHRPDNADAHHNWGVALARLGRFTDAAAHFEQALAIQPAHEEARDYLARARQALRSPPR